MKLDGQTPLRPTLRDVPYLVGLVALVLAFAVVTAELLAWFHGW